MFSPKLGAKNLPLDMASISGFLRKATEKATDVLQNLGIGDSVKFPGRDGDVIYSKNNVCVHPAGSGSVQRHVPGYLSLHCQKDEALGITLILQWLPNATLERNPGSIRTISPRNSPMGSKSGSPHVARIKIRHLQEPKGKPLWSTGESERRRSSSEESSSPVYDPTTDSQTPTSPTSDAEDSEVQEELDSSREGFNAANIRVEMSGDNLTAEVIGEPLVEPSKPNSTRMQSNRPATLKTVANESDSLLGVPSINVIPNTPTTTEFSDEGESPDTEGEDNAGEGAKERRNSSPYSSEAEGEETPTDEEITSGISQLLLSFKNHSDMLDGSPESFAQSHNLLLPDGMQSDTTETDSNAQTVPTRPTNIRGPNLFSVDLGRMRSLRLFYSNAECTCGQLVIASQESQYKILHFHHGGLDKLAQIFERWNVLRIKAKKGEPSHNDMSTRQFAICRPQITKPEQHPEEGIYDKVTWDFWRSCTNAEGSIEDDSTLRKAIFFAGLEPSLRKECWPFMLHVYPWHSAREQRETIRNDLFLEYQNIRKKRLKQAMKSDNKTWKSVENTVGKDVVRTDRRNPFYKGDNNPNIEIMRNILLNYATFVPAIGYIQGMSDLLAPILVELQNESDAFWCFAGLMQRTIFVSVPRNNNMDRNLEHLRELLKLIYPEFFRHLQQLGPDALQMLFTHRWILLCFKREFREAEAFRIWESCWANYQTEYFHLFICLAIISIYGGDIVGQKLPHDEILLYFSSLAMHMSADLVLQKARGLLYQFRRLPSIPCTLTSICDTQADMWDSGHQPDIICVQMHGDVEGCPYRR